MNLTDEITAQRWPRLLREHLRRHPIKALMLDVDGVLTDGRIWVDADGEAIKSFNVMDGHALKQIQQEGVAVAIITGRDSAAVRRRVADLGLHTGHYGVKDKWACASAWLSGLGLDASHLAAMGDDWPDLPVLQRAALACAPASAHIDVRAMAHWVLPQAGGQGAVRELCDAILWSRGDYGRCLAAAQPTLDAR